MVMDPEFVKYDFNFEVGDEILFPISTNSTHFHFNSFDIPCLPNDPDHGILIPSVSLRSEADFFDPSVSASLTVSSSGMSSISPSTTWSPDGDGDGESQSDDSDPVLKYISQMLMEENMEEKPCMFHDPLILKAAEKSLYDVLGRSYPPSPSEPLSSSSPHFDSSFDYFTVNGGNCGCSLDLQQFENSFPGQHVSYSDSQPGSELNPDVLKSQSGFIDSGFVGTAATEHLAHNFFNDSESVLQFKRGLEEASKFLPKNNQLVMDIQIINFPPETNLKVPNDRGNLPNGLRDRKSHEMESSANGSRDKSSYERSLPNESRDKSSYERSLPNESRDRKNHEREDTDVEEGRSTKQSAVFVDESEITEMFDRVLLCTDAKGKPAVCSHENEDPLKIVELTTGWQPNGEFQKSVGVKSRGKKQQKKKETVDLRSLLILCAQAVSTSDCRTADELLKQIRQHSSELGDGSHRLAHCFANGLEARMDGSGTGVQAFFSSLASKRLSAADMLKAYKVYLSACPYKKISYIFANKMIKNSAKTGTTLHIVDFGISYGFQWPILIQHLGAMPGGPPKLRLTGIDHPQYGFRPTERMEETGRRLSKYCDRFGVPFEYNCIAAHQWETIPIEDFKLDDKEILAVNCFYRFKNLLDDTVEENCPRDKLLNLIRKMNPAIFTHAIINGSYNAPFFVTRFREALFHFSSLFDMLEATMSPEDQEQRLLFEREFFGREAMNVIACEGVERVERPETYKQWHVRTLRAGFKPLPLEAQLMARLSAKLKAWYHKDFLLDKDCEWMLQGWKGRILCGSSCWVPE